VAKIVVAIIAANEAPVINRCLESLLPHVDGIYLQDNGDGSTGRIAEAFGCVVSYCRWVDFATNRNQVLDAVRGNDLTRYILCGIDADEELVVPDGYVWPKLTADGYNLLCHYGELRYKRMALVKASHPWKWEGVIHEALVSDTPLTTTDTLDGPYIRVGTGGARSLDPDTQLKDLAVLNAACNAEPENPRYRFYLAQTLKDTGQLDAARSTYRTRAALRGYPPETAYAQYMEGCMEERLGRDPMPAYMQAFNCDPTRAEPLVAAARCLRLNGNPMMAAVLSFAATRMHPPAHGFFVERDVYAWRALDEFVSTAYYVPHLFAAGATAAGVLLGSPDIPAHERERIERNCSFYKEL